MKKNISINISGIIFHIEEDGFDILRKYLDSITKYFSSFEDSTEIVADIESRIAEIFLSKLNEGKQIITAEDVSALKATMGSIQDFQAVEENDVPPSASDEDTSEEDDHKKEESGRKSDTSKRMIRDNKRRILGGVAAGIAHYFSIDPLWIRLFLIALLFSFFIGVPMFVVIVIIYVVLWVMLPESDELEEDTQMRKMYRNPEGSVISGVANGVASYFGIDVAIVRVLFVLFTFIGGVGAIAYLILWIILPEAKSITDKVQMKGEPITLENIESNIKRALQDKDNPDEESTLVRILLFPFRIIAIVLKGIGKAFGPILKFVVDAARIIAGLVLTLIGISMLFSLIIAVGMFFGLLATSTVSMDLLPVELIGRSIPTLGVLSVLVVAGVPALSIMLLGLTVIAKTRIVSATVGWLLFSLWLLGLIGASFTIPKIFYDFRTEGSYTETLELAMDSNQLYLDIRHTGLDEYDGVRIKLEGFEESDVKIVKEYRARGRSKKDAIENSKTIEYTIDQSDSIITFDSNIQFSPEAEYRDQELFITVSIPYDQEFVINEELGHLLRRSIGNLGYNRREIDDNVWAFNPSGLDCKTCKTFKSSNDNRRRSYEQQYTENLEVRGYHKDYDFIDFSELVIDGPFKVNLVQGDEYRVVVNGDNKYVDDVNVEQEGDAVIIDYENGKFDIHRYSRKLSIKIIMPEIQELYFKGATHGNVKGFEQEESRIRLSGAADINFDGDIDNLNVDLSGASKLVLLGVGENLNIDITTASYLDAYQYKAANTTIEASGASKARVYASETLNIDASLVSEVKYRGDAEVTSRRSSEISNIIED